MAAGEAVSLTRRGDAAALLVPLTQIQRNRNKALAEIGRSRKTFKTGNIDVEAFIHEDRT